MGLAPVLREAESPVEGPGCAGEVQGLHEHPAVTDLGPARGVRKAAEPLVGVCTFRRSGEVPWSGDPYMDRPPQPHARAAP